MNPLPKRKWTDNRESNNCHVCKKPIMGGLIKTNKHHCRYCGYIVCSECSKNTRHSSRICDQCYNVYEEKGANSNPLILYPRELWIRDKFINNCTICHCRIKSSLFKSNKHHCRYCGTINCHSCCQYTYFKGSTVRTCDKCYQTQKFYTNRRKLSVLEQLYIRKKYFIFSFKKLIYGYVREFCQMTLINFDGFVNDNIINCLMLYSDELNSCNETWNRDLSHSNSCTSKSLQCIHIKYNKNQVINNINKYNIYYYIFGSNIAEFGMIKTWQIQILNKDYDSPLSIGIIDIQKYDQYCKPSANNDINYVGYGLQLNGMLLRNMSKKELICSAAKNIKIKSNDIIIMTLDLRSRKKGTLIFGIEQKNGNTISKIAFNPDTEKQWRLAVKLGQNDKLLLLERLEDVNWYCK